MTAATLDRPAEAGDPVADGVEALSCPHCRKTFEPAVDPTQPPRLQGAKCPHCRLFVPARVVAAARG